MTTYRERHLAGLHDANRRPDVSWTDSAKTLADQHGLNIADIQGTGRNGQITQADVKAAITNTD